MLMHTERARNEGSTGPKRLDDTRCTTCRRRINWRCGWSCGVSARPRSGERFHAAYAKGCEAVARALLAARTQMRRTTPDTRPENILFDTSVEPLHRARVEAWVDRSRAHGARRSDVQSVEGRVPPAYLERDQHGAAPPARTDDEPFPTAK